MTPTHEAALNSARDSFGVLKELLKGLPDAAVAYAPIAGSNSLAILSAHSIVASRYLFSCGSGAPRSFTAYRAGERAASFESTSATVASLEAAINAALAEFETILGGGRDAHLPEIISWPGEEGAPTRSGALCLVHACAHLREHVGQAELTRDLWLARQS